MIYVGDFQAKSLAQEIQEVNEANASWIEVCFVQFLTVGVSDVPKAIEVAPDAPYLASVGARRRRKIV